jgi:hypothetical protein
MLIVLDYGIVRLSVCLVTVASFDEFGNRVEFIQRLYASPAPLLQSTKISIESRQSLILR